MINKLLIQGLLITSVVGLAACTGGEGRQAQHYERAQQFFDNDNFDKARIEIKNVLQINPEHAAGRYLLALISERERNWQKMFTNLYLAVELNPQHVPSRLKFGQMLFANKMYDKVLEQADAVLASSVDNPDAWVLKGSVFFRQGKLDEAIRHAELALKEQPGHVAAISLLAAVYSDEEPERALAIIGDGISLQTHSATLKLLKISLLVRQGQVEQAISVYKQLLKDYPDNLLFHYQLVRLYQQHDYVDAAEELLREIVNTKPENSQLKLWLAQFLADNRNPLLAQTTLEQFIIKQPDNFALQFALGQLYAGTGDRDKAETVYREIIQRDVKGADSLIARNKLIELSLLANQRAQADSLLAEVFTIEPENTEGLITRAKILLFEKKNKTAIADLRTVLRNKPDSIEALMLLAQAHEKDGALDLALDNYRQALVVKPRHEQALYHAARMAFSLGQLDSAEALLHSLREMRPQHADASRLLVELLSKQQRWDEAHLEADGMLFDPKSLAMGHYLKGRVYFSQRKYPAAIQSLQQALEVEPGIIEALRFLIDAYGISEREREGLAYLNTHLKNHPDHAHAHELLGAYHHKTGRFSEAFAAFKEAIALAPGRPSAYRRLGALHISRGEWQQAGQTYTQGIVSNPDESRLKVLLASVYSQTGDYQKARGIYESLLAEHPSMQQAANNLAVILAEHMPNEENLRSALQLAESLRESRHPAFLDTLGWVNLKLGNTSRALSLLESSVALGGDGPQYHYHLGMAYYQESQLVKARQHLELALLENDSHYIGRDEAQLTLETIQSTAPSG